MLALAGMDASNWTPQFNYWVRPEALDDGGANVVFADGHVDRIRQAVRTTTAGYQGWFPDSTADDSDDQALTWHID